jgi:hypothetical protein
MATYADTLVTFNDARGAYTPPNLFAGEADIITDRAQVHPGMHLAKHTVVAQDANGYLTKYDPQTRASLLLTFGGTGTANDTVTINGVVFTLVASAATATQVTIGASAAATAENFAAVMNSAANVAATGCYGVLSGATVNVVYIAGGTAGNSIAVAEAGTGTSFAGGATALANGATTRTTTYGKAIGITLEPVAAVDAPVDCPYYSGGIFNHEELVWPAADDTLAERRAAFNGSNINVASLL